MWRSAAALLCAASWNVALAQDTTPLTKVVELLAGLRDNIMSEAEAEASTYNEFACFCKDGISEKSSEIATGDNSKTTFESDLSAAILDRDTQDQTIEQKQQAIGTAQSQIEGLTKTRHDELLAYETNEVDLTAAVQALEAAIRALKASQTAIGFAQVQPALKKVVATAKAVGITSESQKKAVALLKAKDFPDGFTQPAETYTFQGGDIITTLEGLLEDFRGAKIQLQTDETSARQSYDLQVQTLEQSITGYQGEVDEAQRLKAAAVLAASTANADLTATSAELLGDQQYLTQLSERCHEKALLWDQRTQARANELSALTQALAIIQSENVTGSAGLAQIRAAVTRSAARRGLNAAGLTAQPVRRHTFGLRWASPPRPRLSAAAVHVVRKEKAATLSRRSRIVALLRSKAASLKSGLLTLMAGRIADDPFEKVKTMIQELIERLLKEASDEANHKGWCDGEVSAATIKRDTSAEAIRELNGKLEVGEVRIQKLTELVADLDSELSEIGSELSNATDLRNQEKTENEKAIQDAQAGSAAVAQAISLLKIFFGEAANNATALVQQPVTGDSLDEDLPDAGFDGAYAGAQDAKEGLIGMLEVVQGDFDKAAQTAREAEAEQAQEFLELEKALGAANATKTVAIGERTRALNEANATDIADLEGLSFKQTELNNALSEMEALREACFDGGQSAEERKIQRDEEIAALNQALCILSSADNGASC